MTAGLQVSAAELLEVTEDCLAGGKEGTECDTRMTRAKGDRARARKEWAPWG